MKRALGGVAMLVVCLGCGRTANGDQHSRDNVQIGQAAQSGDRQVGSPEVTDNLTVFPILSKSQQDVGPMTTLDAAIAKGAASVHEVGADGRANTDSAQVNTLVIDNKGDVPIYVLAGTIVKGGKQDRQIGDDFIVGARQAVPVDAYCVEHGRWTAVRNGAATGGQFNVAGVLTDSKVRTAAQYKHDQGEVWAKVAAVNAVHNKLAPSGTLMASVDSGDIAARRAAVAKRAEVRLDAVKPNEEIVGMAYAVGGKVRSARWFANHKVFALFESTLLQTAAMEAITAQSEAAASGAPAAPAASVAAADVSSLLDDVQRGAIKEQRATPALNVNAVRESKAGYGASTMFKTPAASPAAPPRPVSTSVTSF